MPPLDEALREFVRTAHMHGKGSLCVAIAVTRHARVRGLPLRPQDLLTESGQVVGASQTAVQAILREHGVEGIPADEEGGTRRSSAHRMHMYVDFLNRLHEDGIADLAEIENWWTDRARACFEGGYLTLRTDGGYSLCAAVRDVLLQAEKRELRSPGAAPMGAVLRHLIAAKLELVLEGRLNCPEACVAEIPTQTACDFAVEDVRIHVVAAPSEALLRKCIENLDAGMRPLIVTTQSGMAVAEGLSEQMGVGHRVDVFEAEEFIAGNLYRLGGFTKDGTAESARRLIEKYNVIVAERETDPALHIAMDR